MSEDRRRGAGDREQGGGRDVGLRCRGFRFSTASLPFFVATGSHNRHASRLMFRVLSSEREVQRE